jgi:hypothetical protein
MANKTPHVVGGGLGTFRKEARAKHEAERKSQQEADRKAAMARIAKSLK